MIQPFTAMLTPFVAPIQIILSISFGSSFCLILFNSLFVTCKFYINSCLMLNEDLKWNLEIAFLVEIYGNAIFYGSLCMHRENILSCMIWKSFDDVSILKLILKTFKII